MKVLLVDDDPIMQRMFGRALEQDGHTVITAGDGASVQNLAVSEHPDIILLDQMMPNMSGMEALRALKADEQTKAIPVIMLSAYDDGELVEQAMEVGADRYLTKSALEPEQVAAIVQQTYDESHNKS